MKQHIRLYILLLLVHASGLAVAQQDTAFSGNKVVLETATGNIVGVMATPAGKSSMPVALIIAGSGPTDRDGNNPVMKNNSLKMLAAALLKQGIACLRYDKRGVGESAAALKSEAAIRFDDYVNDARAWISFLRKDKRFSKIVVIGHSEGSLIGMIAGKEADQFVSIAGAGQSADKILKEQLKAQPASVQDMAFPIIDSLSNGQLVSQVPPLLFSLFRPSVQPYLISWFKYDPATEIKKLSIPVLITQGTTDIQVSVEDAKRLHAAIPKAQLLIINGMNHVLKLASADRQANIKTYSDPNLPLAPELVQGIVDFTLK
jgi:hypothetical protein